MSHWCPALISYLILSSMSFWMPSPCIFSLSLV
jgi:hypothetical protein